jgi:hypothetical protein
VVGSFKERQLTKVTAPAPRGSRRLQVSAAAWLAALLRSPAGLVPSQPAHMSDNRDLASSHVALFDL